MKDLLNVIYAVKDFATILAYRDILEHILVINLINVYGNGFSVNSNLQTNIRRHTDDIPYKCHICGKELEPYWW